MKSGAAASALVLLSASCAGDTTANSSTGTSTNPSVESAPGSDTKASRGEWFTNHEEALEAAASEKRVVLADFTGSDWCGWCVRLKEEVFDTSEFKEWAAKNVVLLELDFPRRTKLPAELKAQNEALAKKHGVQGFPTILFFDAKGKKLGRMGYEAGGPANWIRKADSFVMQAR